MKVTIEIDLPEGQAIPSAYDCARLTDPNWLASWWHIDDIKEQYLGDGEYSELTDEEAREVLRLADKEHDCEYGLNWEVFDGWADYVKAQRKATA
jgi:hypothetical protein